MPGRAGLTEAEAAQARNGKRRVEAQGVLALFAAGALTLALASPAPAPNPTPTNPFNLIPIAPPSTLPVIGTTRSKPVCTAIRKARRPRGRRRDAATIRRTAGCG